MRKVYQRLNGTFENLVSRFKNHDRKNNRQWKRKYQFIEADNEGIFQRGIKIGIRKQFSKMR